MKWLFAVLAFAATVFVPANSLAGGVANPNASISNISATAVGHENRQAVFTITLDAPAGSAASLDYTTRDGSALAATHYVADSGTIVIPANTSSATISITLLPQDFQADKTFSIDLTGSSNLNVAVGTATATITTRKPTFSTGDAVPGAPTGTTFRKPGNPAINKRGDTAFATTINTPAGSATAIFATDQLIATRGEATPGVSGGIFSTFQPPAQNDNGKVAFVANLTGTIPASRRTALFSNLGGSLNKVVRLGDPAPGLTGLTLTRIHSFALSDDAIFFTGYYCNHNVTPQFHSYSLCSWTPTDGVRILLREGREFNNRTVTRIDTLLPTSSSLGLGRSVRGSTLTARLSFSTGASAIVIFDKNGNGTTITQSGDTAPSSGIAKFRAFGRPMLNENSRVAVQGLLTGSATAAALFGESSSALERLIGVADPLPGAAGVNVSASDAPAWNDLGDVAAIVTVAGTGVTAANSKAIVSKRDGLPPTTLARLGDRPPGTPLGARWKAFRSLSIGDDRGPIFVGTLATGSGGITSANDTGLWATDSLGALVPIVRESDTLVVNGTPKTVLTFTALSLVAGSPDQSRTISENGYVAYLANFTDGTSSVVRVRVP